MESVGPSIGLHLNCGKSLLHVPGNCEVSENPLPSDIPISKDGFYLLGCPIGSPSFCEEVLQGRVSKIKETLKIVHDMGDSQLETALLRSCLALPKVTYILRTCPPSHIVCATREFDMAIREALEGIQGGPCPEWSWLKASLPSSQGGINLRSAAAHAPAAFIASTTSCKELVEGILGHSPSPSNTSTKLSPLSLLPLLVLTGNSWMMSMCRCTNTTCLSPSMRLLTISYFHLQLQSTPVLLPTLPAYHMRIAG